MELKWLGHACFQLKSAEGVSLVTDPFNDRVGYPVPRVHADIVTESHQHGDHNYADELTGEPRIIASGGVVEINGVLIRGVDTFHDNEGGAKRGGNIVFVLQMDGIVFCHLGDLGHELSEEQAREIGPVDVLMIPVGGFYTIDAEIAARVCDRLKPALTIPMHYRNEQCQFPIDGVEPFIELAGGTNASTESSLILTREGLDAGEPESGVWIFKAPME